MIDWVEFLANNGLAPSTACEQMRELEAAWHQGISEYSDFIKSLICLYSAIEGGIDRQRLRYCGRIFVTQEPEFLFANSVGAVLFGLFAELGIKVHVVSGGPLVVLRQYKLQYNLIGRISGISSDGASDLLTFKQRAVISYSDRRRALFGIGDSDTDVPLFGHADYPIGINFDNTEVHARGGLLVKTGAGLRMSSQAISELGTYVRFHLPRKGEEKDQPISPNMINSNHGDKLDLERGNQGDAKYEACNCDREYQNRV